MDLIRTASAMHARARADRTAGHRIALVPTMGALHEGHIQLVREARKQAAVVYVSIFVNPTQFAPNEDLDAYPRTLTKDMEQLRVLGDDIVVFAPADEEIYPYGRNNVRIWVQAEQLADHLCGAHRDGHFRGVTTVVTKLLNLCKPDVAVFGLKDAQQFFILQRLVQELCYNVELIGVPTVREPDGLAMSSRNVYLTASLREQAVVVSKAVNEAHRLIKAGEQRVSVLVEAMRSAIGEAPDARIQYADVVDTTVLQPLTTLQPGQHVLAAAAVYFGQTRLIDNTITRVPAPVSVNQS